MLFISAPPPSRALLGTGIHFLTVLIHNFQKNSSPIFFR